MRGLALALLLIASSALAQEEPGFRVGAVVMMESVMGAEADKSLRPAADLELDGPIAFGEKTPLRLNGRLRLYGLPGESFNIGDVGTVRAVDVSLGATRRVGRVFIGEQELWTSVEAEWGFATSLPDEDEASSGRHLRHYGGGLRMEERKSGAWLSLLYGRDETAGEWGWGQWMVSGAVPVSIKEREVLVIGGDATLSVGPRTTAVQKDIVRVFVGVSLPGLMGAITR